MITENGKWMVCGIDWDSPGCLHTVEDAIEYVKEIGFLPFFQNEIPGFSLEERTFSDGWWGENPDIDPWKWREVLAREDDIVYGKFFGKRAGFITKEWFPIFANYRRDGYDFDALFEDGKAPVRNNKIMINFMNENADAMIMSNELKKIAGFGKGGEKGFDTAVTALMMQTYLINCDFKYRKNQKGEEYGWEVAVYSTPERKWGYDCVASAYKESPAVSREKLSAHIKELYHDASAKQIEKVLRL